MRTSTNHNHVMKLSSYLKKVGQRIAEARTQRGLTQEKLAKKAGVSIHMVRYWEAGGNLSLKTVAKISRLLGQPIPELLKNSNHTPPKMD